MKTIHEKKRGCGYRKPGGLYLFSDGKASPCGRLPIPVHVCPTCGNGVKAGRGFQWVKWEFLDRSAACFASGCGGHCPLMKFQPEEKLGLMWVGEKYYPTPEDFMKEARGQGVSKRIPAVPRDFVLGKTWLALAHRKAIVTVEMETLPEGDDVDVYTYSPGIFSLFLPTEIQYCVRGDETEEQLADMEKKGITPVAVVYDETETVTT